MKLLFALTLSAFLVAGCSDSSTQSPANAGSNPLQDGGNNQDDSGTGGIGSNGGTSTGDETTDSGGSDDTSNSTDIGESGTGDSASGSTGNNNTGSGGDTEIACTSTDVGIAFQSVSTTTISDPDAAPNKLLDGCVDRAYSWSGDNGSIVTLDAGSVHQMQGVYIWSTFARMEWIKIESSADGQNWAADWHAVLTKPVNGPVYYGLKNTGSKRFVRITGFGSDLNSWTNITEVRWSLAGYDVSGAKILRDTNAARYQSAALSEHILLPMMSRHTNFVTNICIHGPEASFVDVTGFGSQFLQIKTITGAKAYAIDWDHYARLNQDPDYFTEGPVEPFGDYQDFVFDQPDFSFEDNPTLCGQSMRGDQWYGFTQALVQMLSGAEPSIRDNWR